MNTDSCDTVGKCIACGLDILWGEIVIPVSSWAVRDYVASRHSRGDVHLACVSAGTSE